MTHALSKFIWNSEQKWNLWGCNPEFSSGAAIQNFPMQREVLGLTWGSQKSKNLKYISNMYDLGLNCSTTLN